MYLETVERVGWDVMFQWNEIWKLKQMWLFPNVLYVTVKSLCKNDVEFYVIFLHFISDM